MICKGCHWTLSLTEAGRGQRYCNRCESQLQTKLGCAMQNVAGMGWEERELSRQRFENLPVPPFAQFAYMGNLHEFMRSR